MIAPLRYLLGCRRLRVTGAAPEDLAAAGVISASSNASDAVEALVALGYPQSEASLAVGRLDSGAPVEHLVREALKSLAKKL